MDLLPSVALAALGALALTRLLMPAARRAGLAWGLVDHPSWRRRQKAAVPCSGGLAIYGAGVVVAAILVSAVGPAFEVPALLALGIAGFGTVLLGVVDDRFGLHAEKKLLGQVIVVSLPMAAGLTLQRIAIPFAGTLELGVFAGPVTLFWYLGFINSINLIDGLDGLAGGIVAVVLGALFVAIVGVDPVGAVWIAALLGAVTGFLRDNLSRERIFLGDAGSMLLGLWLAGLALGLSGARPELPLLAACAMAVPALDTATTILRRWRRGVSMFRPDAEHLHHRLLQLGTPPLRATLVLWSLSVAAAAFGIALFGTLSAALVALSALSAAAIQLAYTLERDQHPRPSRVLTYLLGAHPTLHPIDPAERLAEVIEMERYRERPPLPARAFGVDSRGEETEHGGSAPAVAAHEDVVLAVPDETRR